MIRYDKAGATCSGGNEPGVKELAQIITDNFPNIRARADSTYNCRDIRGRSSMSMHGVGRALDVFPKTKEAGDFLAGWLLLNASRLNVQCVIWYRRIWSARHASVGWRPYNGKVPHTDHVHIELNKLGGDGEIEEPTTPAEFADLVAAGLVGNLNDGPGDALFGAGLLGLVIIGLAGYGVYRMVT